MRKKIVSYVGSTPAMLIFGVFFLILSLLSFLPDVKEPFIMFGFMFFFSVICTLIYVIGRSKLNKTLERYRQKYGSKAIASDFQKSQPVINGLLRAGHEWMFGKRTGTIIRYDEITKIYLYIHRTNGIEDKRALMIEAGGKARELCKIPTKGVFKKQNHPDVDKVLKYVLVKNPNVHVGYK